jgi:hypothetical protein
MFYSFFFIGAFVAEMSLILLSPFILGNSIIDIRFIVLVGITFVAMMLFSIEGLKLYRKLNPKTVNEK